MLQSWCIFPSWGTCRWIPREWNVLKSKFESTQRVTCLNIAKTGVTLDKKILFSILQCKLTSMCSRYHYSKLSFVGQKRHTWLAIAFALEGNVRATSVNMIGRWYVLRSFRKRLGRIVNYKFSSVFFPLLYICILYCKCTIFYITIVGLPLGIIAYL